MDTHRAKPMFIDRWGNSMKGTVTNKLLFHIREHVQELRFANPSTEMRVDFDQMWSNDIDLISVTRTTGTLNASALSHGQGALELGVL